MGPKFEKKQLHTYNSLLSPIAPEGPIRLSAGASRSSSLKACTSVPADGLSFGQWEIIVGSRPSSPAASGGAEVDRPRVLREPGQSKDDFGSHG